MSKEKAVEYMRHTTTTQIQLLNSIMALIESDPEAALQYCKESKEQLIDILEMLKG